MVLLFDVDALVKGNLEDGSRVEYRAELSSKRTLHTVCAFANDIGNRDGGYVVIGVDDEGGDRKIVGIDPDSVESVIRKITSLCKTIQPKYSPVVGEAEVDGKTLVVIRAPAGVERPYTCPVSKNEKETACYIRRSSFTIQALESDVRELESMKVPFDDCVNAQASLADIDLRLVCSLLCRTGVDAYDTKMSEQEMYRMTDIVRGPKGDLRPVNVALMFFNRNPERFFRGVRIEVTIFPDDGGNTRLENVFRGPLDMQLEDALQYVRNFCIAEMVSDGKEPVRTVNYPYDAVRYALVRAVCFRNYESESPVRVVIRHDRMEVSFPMDSVTYAAASHLGQENLPYSNRRICEYLEQLGLCTGPGISESMQANGSATPEYVFDDDSFTSTIVLPIHPSFLSSPQLSRKEASEEDRIIAMVRSNGGMTIREISESLGYSGINKRVVDVVKGMIADGRLCYLYPDAPRSPKQRVCIGRG